MAWFRAEAATAFGAVAAACLADPSFAHEPPPPASPTPTISTSLPGDGDPYGTRHRLSARGLSYSLMYTNDVLANLDGGQKRGTIDQGKLEGTLSIDLEKMAGWQGLSFFANGFYLHNTGRIRRDYVGGINTIAAIEAVPATRLSEIWFEQKLLDGKASLRIGQLDADVEFFFSSAAILFLQSDWATITALNLPSGGPAYPLSTPGIRIKYMPSSDLAMLFALFNGDPAGPGTGDEQLRNRHGLNFRVQDPPFLIAEIQSRHNTQKEAERLAKTFKLGGWAHFGAFDDRRFAYDGSLLADPAGPGAALRRRGNSGIYAVVDQQVYRPAGGDAESGITIFGRASASPDDRNQIGWFWDGGIVFADMIPGRANDKFGASFMYAQFSDAVRDFDRDMVRYGTRMRPVRDFEANLELTYSAEIKPGFNIQPMATYIWHPGGESGRNATVVGIRSFLRY